MAPGLRLPAGAAMELMAIVGRAQSGKTAFAARFAGRLLERGIQVVVFDNAGAWAPENGRRLLALPVAGGRHGDGPFVPATGPAAIAALRDLPGAIIDLSLQPRTVRGKVVSSALEALLTREDDEKPLHIVIDEAGLLPRSLAELGPLGAHRRIGATLIAQRLQALDTAALNQSSYLIAHCMTGPHDRRAFGDWLRGHNPQALADSASLAGLAVGEALAWRADEPYEIRRIRVPGGPREPIAMPVGQSGAVRRWLDICAGEGGIPDPLSDVETIVAAAERLRTSLAVEATDGDPRAAEAEVLTTRPEWPSNEYERDVLRAVVQDPGCSRNRAAVLAGRSWRSQTFANAVLALRTAGLVELTEDDTLRPGVVPDGPVDALPDGRELLDRWGGILDHRREDDAHRETLQALLSAHPDAVNVTEVPGLGEIGDEDLGRVIVTLRALGLATGEARAFRLAAACGLEDSG